MSDAWYVSAQNQVYGPYSGSQLRQFIDEKRIVAATLIRSGEQETFVQACEHPSLSRVFGRMHSESSGGVPLRNPRRRASDRQNGGRANFLIIVEFRSGSALRYEKELKEMGDLFRYSHSVWMLQTLEPIIAIKNRLSPLTGNRDTLLIVDATRNQLAWHNIGAVEMSTMREHWKLPADRQTRN